MPKYLLIISVAIALITPFAADASPLSPLNIKIRKVADGAPGSGPAFVELQMFTAGQTSLAGHTLSFWQPGPSGPVPAPGQVYTFPSGVVLDGTNQRRILVSSNTWDGVPPDFPGSFDFTGFSAGAICFDDTDCVAWGPFAGSEGLPSPVGTAAATYGDTAIERYITTNCATALEAADDSNNSAVDFFTSDRTRHNNASTISEASCDRILKDGFDGTAASPLNIKIRKVADAAPGPGPAFVELQMFTPGQTNLAGHTLSFWQPGPSGPVQVQSQVYTFPPGVVLDGTNQRRILVSPVTWDSIAPDFPGSFDFTGYTAGAICLDDIDCVAWGSFTGSENLPSPVGTPAATYGDGAIERHINGNCATALDGADDTDNSVVDFFATDRTRHNNASTITEQVCP